MTFPYDECVVWTGGSIRTAKQRIGSMTRECCKASFPVVGTAVKEDDSDTPDSRIIDNLASCGRNRNGGHVTCIA